MIYPVPARDAAARLAVSERRVRALLESGALRGQKIGNRWFVDRDAIDGLRARRRSGGRPIEPANAWAALFLASGAEPRWLSRPAQARVRRRLGKRSLDQLAPRLSARGSARYYVGNARAQEQIASRPDFVVSGVSAAEHYGADVIAPGVVEGYLPADQIERLVYLHALRAVGELQANIVLRSVRGRWPFGEAGIAPKAVVAADLAESQSERTRDAGLRLLRGLPSW